MAVSRADRASERRGRPEFPPRASAAHDVAGWLTPDQAWVLWDAASALPPGAQVVEIGSHEGRSAIVLASVPHLHLTCVDPFPPDWRYGAEGTRRRLEDNLARAGVASRVTVVEATSADVRARWDEPVSMVYVDGKHDVRTVLDDLRWAEHLVPGGQLLLHDAFSSVGVTLAVLRLLAPGARLRYLDRTGSLARFERGAPGLAGRWRIVRELPWWGRNLGLKLLLRLRLRPVARALGHHDAADPY